MSTHIDHLVQIKNYIQHAHLCHEKGLACLHYTKALALLKEIPVDPSNCLSPPENVGEKPNEFLLL